jgi:hypothetical protein
MTYANQEMMTQIDFWGNMTFEKTPLTIIKPSRY